MFGALAKKALGKVGGFLKNRVSEIKEKPGLLKSIGDFKSWNQRRQNGGAPQGFGPGSNFGPPQGGGGFQKPGGGSPLMGGNFKRSPFPQMEQPGPAQPPPQLGGGPQTGGAEPSPWAMPPAGGQGPSLGGRGGFMPPPKPPGMGSVFGRGTGNLGGGYEF